MKNIIIAIAAILVLASCTADKTAYVDTTILLKEYNEMKDADKKYTARSERLKKQLDSVAQEFQIAFNSLYAEFILFTVKKCFINPHLSNSYNLRMNKWIFPF